jgi:hypothetical protein
MLDRVVMPRRHVAQVPANRVVMWPPHEPRPRHVADVSMREYMFSGCWTRVANVVVTIRALDLDPTRHQASAVGAAVRPQPCRVA